MAQIPYKIYLDESELPKAWYNLRADMKNKPAPLLNPATLKPMTFEELRPVFCDELIRQELGVEAKAVATGGLSGMIGRQTGAFAAIDKSLTLDGLELIYREGHRHGC